MIRPPPRSPLFPSPTLSRSLPPLRFLRSWQRRRRRPSLTAGRSNSSSSWFPAADAMQSLLFCGLLSFSPPTHPRSIPSGPAPQPAIARLWLPRFPAALFLRDALQNSFPSAPAVPDGILGSHNTNPAQSVLSLGDPPTLGAFPSAARNARGQQ